MEEEDQALEEALSPDDSSREVSPFDEALYSRVQDKEENRTPKVDSEEVWSNPEVIIAVKNYKRTVVPNQDKLREIIHSKTGVLVPRKALSDHLRTIKTLHIGDDRLRGLGGIKNLHAVRRAVPQGEETAIKNLHIVRQAVPQGEETASPDIPQEKPAIFENPIVKESLEKYRNFEIASLEELRQVIFEKMKVWISCNALSDHMKDIRKDRPKRAGLTYPRQRYIPTKGKPRKRAEKSVNVDDESSSAATSIEDAKLKSAARPWRLPPPPKKKEDKYKTGRQVQGDFIVNKAIFHVQDGPDRHTTYRLKRRLADVKGIEPERMFCVQCSYARYGARKSSVKRGCTGDDLAPLNEGPIKRIRVMPDGWVLDMDEGQHHQDCKPWTDLQMILYRDRVDKREKKKMGIIVGKAWKTKSKRSKEERQKYMAEKEKIRKCVMRLDAVGVSMQQIGPTINFIWETLAESTLDIMPSYNSIKGIIYNQKKKLKRQAAKGDVTSPSSGDRLIPKKRPKKSPSKIRSPSDVTLDYDYEPEYERVVIIDDDHIQRSRKSQSKIRSPSNLTLKYDYEPETRVVVVDSMDDDDHIQMVWYRQDVQQLLEAYRNGQIKTQKDLIDEIYKLTNILVGQYDVSRHLNGKRKARPVGRPRKEAPYFPYRDGPNGYGSRRQDYSF